jgi:effector-binding domain-containing protein
MTTPVEAEMNPGVMYFYIGTGVSKHVLDATEKVSVHELPERLVASLGVRGGYNERNFDKASAKLSAWLLKNPGYEAIGEVRGVFWNGPFMPGFIKRFEVHIPVQLVKE